MKLYEKYNQPTPLKWRKIGDLLLIISTTITSYSVIEEMKEVALIAAILGCVGKILTNFFTDELNNESI
jgi:hypothetical protein